MTTDALSEPALRDGAEVAADLGVDPEVGLSSAEAARRLERDGRNELLAKPPVPFWRKVLAQFKDPLIYLLLVAVAVSVVSWLAEGAHGVPVDAIVIAIVVVINAAIGLIEENRAETAVAALQSMTAATSTVLRDGRLCTVPSEKLVRGDLLVLNEGDAVGADARLLSAAALRVSEASLTGESEPVTKSAARQVEIVPLGDRTGMVFRGTAVAQGVGRAVVTATGMDTEMGDIAEMLDVTVEEPSPLRREIAAVGKFLSITVVVIAVVVMVVTVLANDVSTLDEYVTVLLLGVSLAVAAVPEGLPAIVSVVLAIGVRRMAARNAIVKSLPSVETLGSATVIASDKTGTLTKNEMTIQRVCTASGQVELTGLGYRPEGSARTDGHELTDPALAREAGMVICGGALAGNAQLAPRDDEWEIQGDPTEAAFLVAVPKLDGAAEATRRFSRIAQAPFTSERKMMSVLVRDDDARADDIVAKGAPDVLLQRCTAVQVGDEAVRFDDGHRATAISDIEALSESAYRTLAVAYRRMDGQPEQIGEDDERDLTYIGVVGMIDPPRAEVKDAIAQARKAGVRIVMITGDHPTTAVRIAQDLGIVGPGAKAIVGAELDGLTPEQLRAVTATTSVYARVAPRNKLQIVQALQAQDEVVAVTGDGVNDAPALKAADIGVAMGIAGTEVSKDAAQMILGDDNFATIVAAVRQGRVIFDNIKKFLRYLLTSNMGEVFTVFFGVLLASYLGIAGASGDEVVLPLLATQILWINLVTDSAPALAMSVDPEIDDVMARPPRRVTDRIIDRTLWTGALSIGLAMAVAMLLTMDIFLPGGLVEGSDSLAVARTAGFTTLVLAQLVYAFSARSATGSMFHHLFSNAWLWGAVALGVALQAAVVYVPFLQTGFGTAALGWEHWGVAIGMALLVVVFVELRKLVLRSVARVRARRHDTEPGLIRS